MGIILRFCTQFRFMIVYLFRFPMAKVQNKPILCAHNVCSVLNTKFLPITFHLKYFNSNKSKIIYGLKGLVFINKCAHQNYIDSQFKLPLILQRCYKCYYKEMTKISGYLNKGVGEFGELFSS